MLLPACVAAHYGGGTYVADLASIQFCVQHLKTGKHQQLKLKKRVYLLEPN